MDRVIEWIEWIERERETCIDDYVTLVEDGGVTGAGEGCVLVLREEAEHVHGQRLVGLEYSPVSTSAFTCTYACHLSPGKGGILYVEVATGTLSAIVTAAAGEGAYL